MKKDDPAFDYDKYGQKYSGTRQTDPRIAEYVFSALGDAKTILNVGGGIFLSILVIIECRVIYFHFSDLLLIVNSIL